MLYLRGGARKLKRRAVILPIVFLTVLLDQASKALILSRLSVNETIAVIPGVFNVVHYRNTGAAFGLLKDAGFWGAALLIAFPVAAISVICYLLSRSLGRLTDISLSLIAAGAAGNLIDRIRFGEVVDFLDFYAGPYHWPAFNAADSAITAGVVLLFISAWFDPKR